MSKNTILDEKKQDNEKQKKILKQEIDKNLTIDSLYNIPVNISVVLGKTNMQLSDLLKLSKGAVVELNKGVNELVDVYANNEKIAKGEIVVVDDNKIGVTLIQIVNRDKK